MQTVYLLVLFSDVMLKTQGPTCPFLPGASDSEVTYLQEHNCLLWGRSSNSGLSPDAQIGHPVVPISDWVSPLRCLSQTSSH